MNELKRVLMALCEKILIVGFAGSGKTTLLEAARKSAPPEWTDFQDLDALILKEKGKGFSKLSDLIESVGWEKFRLWERQVLEGWLKEEGRGVLATGGGTLNRLLWEMLKGSRKVRIIYLDVDFETCWARVIKDHVERPLVKRGKEELKKIFEERSLVFREIPIKLKDSLDTNMFWKEVSS
jgi:shikimate kinase